MSLVRIALPMAALGKEEAGDTQYSPSDRDALEVDLGVGDDDYQ